jgi:hypothetical protein
MRAKIMTQVAKTREKGKIARKEWPKIVGRYKSGETIASIGRGYGCTAPAIRYIIKRSGVPLKEGRLLAVSRNASRSRISGGANNMISTQTTAASFPAVAPLREHTVGGHLLGVELRKRVSGDLATFLVALDHLVADCSREDLINLQDATDCLMRSIARTRMEVERLLSIEDAAAAN